MTAKTQDGRLTPMSELTNYRIKADDPDPRGWTVVAATGRIGHVIDLLVDIQRMQVRRLLVYAGQDGKGDASLVTIDVANVDVRKNAQQIFARGRGERYSGSYSDQVFTANGGETATRESGKDDALESGEAADSMRRS